MQHISMMIGSPKAEKSQTHKFASELEGMLEDSFYVKKFYLDKESMEYSDFEQILKSDKVILCCPLYVDCLPSGVLEFMNQFEGFLNRNLESLKRMHIDPWKMPQAYGLINCGFLEGKQTQVALQIMERFFHTIKFSWEQGLGIGGGGFILDSPFKNAVTNKLHVFSTTIMQPPFVEQAKQEKQGEKEKPEKKANLYVQMPIPKFMFVRSGDEMWVQAAQKKGVDKKELGKKFYL